VVLVLLVFALAGEPDIFSGEALSAGSSQPVCATSVIPSSLISPSNEQRAAVCNSRDEVLLLVLSYLL
jgi:hypothetical protein